MGFVFSRMPGRVYFALVHLLKPSTWFLKYLYIHQANDQTLWLLVRMRSLMSFVKWMQYCQMVILCPAATILQKTS